MQEETQENRTIRPFSKKKQLQVDLAKVSQEIYRRNRELLEINKTLSLLQTIDGLVLESHTSLKFVCQQIAQAVTVASDYPFVGLFARSSRNEDELSLYGWSIKDKPKATTLANISRPLHISLENSWFSSAERTKIISLDSLSDEMIAEFLGVSPSELHSLRRSIPIKSLYVIKLLARHRLVGMIVVGFLESMTQLNDYDRLLFDRLGDSVGVAVDNKQLFEENRYVLRQLRESNTKLKALDETKDDFISMASHQLRTPLTSVKGYLSLVLDGDAGNIKPQQRQLLTQAFTSSQRMVYLISDLLNVSRLKTGRFIIEATPINLADVITDEVAQLHETAASRSLKLEYHKPHNFPVLMLDETKIRQVIMNFMDNAIYYTPSGGVINVKLIDTGPAIELRVEDNGIGVPKSEQPHLFTKFYRAGNARKARPDGTGLGLFMAKKVITAQGGALIFESHEGKGSTFGFIFAKSQLSALPEQPVKT